MTDFSGERPATPDDLDVIQAWHSWYRENTHTSFPASVQSYNAGAQTADLQPLVKHAVLQSDGSSVYEVLPILPSVPVVFPRCGNFFLALPIQQGDTVLVVCCESAIGPWRTGDGSVQPPGDLRRFDLSHAVCLPGLFTAAKALAQSQTSGDISTDFVVGKVGGPQIALRGNGTIAIASGGTVIAEWDGTVWNFGAASAAAFVALASLVDSGFSALVTALNTHVHTSAAPTVPTSTPIVPFVDPPSTAATKVKAT